MFSIYETLEQLKYPYNFNLTENSYNDLASDIEKEELSFMNNHITTEDDDNKNFISNINNKLNLSPIVANLPFDKSMDIEEINKNELKTGNPVKKHTKYDEDNIRRKCKHFILDSVFNHINIMIRKLYNNKIGQGIFKKQLQTLNQKQKSESNIKFNQEFLYKTIGEIFSDKISGRITNFPPDYNKFLIQSLLNEKDEAKKKYFNNLFSLTFLECLEHFRGSKNITILNGMHKLNDILEEYKEEPDYASNLEYYLNNYEIIINNKKSRKKRKNKSKNVKND